MLLIIMSMCSIFGAIMIKDILISTVNQRVIQFLAKKSDKDFHEREIARRTGIAAGSDNRALNELYNSGVIKRRQEGKMLFYSIDSSAPVVTEFKKLVNILLLEPLLEELKSITSRITLYGSCAQGTDTSKSDMDIFIVTKDRDGVTRALEGYRFPLGLEEIQIQAIIKTPVELLEAGKAEQVFLDEVEQGIVLWQGGVNER
jgi:predicted nucleotidyltransferase